MLLSLREKCPYSEFFWSVFSCIWTEYGEMQSKSLGKYGAEKFRIRTLGYIFETFVLNGNMYRQNALLLKTLRIYLHNGRISPWLPYYENKPQSCCKYFPNKCEQTVDNRKFGDMCYRNL